VTSRKLSFVTVILACMYETMKSFHKTQAQNKSFKIPVNKLLCATDLATKVTQFVPGPGKYNLEKAMKTFYKPYYKNKR
jgi:hypothetical protein